MSKSSRHSKNSQGSKKGSKANSVNSLFATLLDNDNEDQKVSLDFLPSLENNNFNSNEQDFNFVNPYYAEPNDNLNNFHIDLSNLYGDTNLYNRDSPLLPRFSSRGSSRRGSRASSKNSLPSIPDLHRHESFDHDENENMFAPANVENIGVLIQPHRSNVQHNKPKRIRKPIRTHRRPSAKNPVPRKPIVINNHQRPLELTVARNAYSRRAGDWFDNGFVDVVTDGNGQHKVIATRNLFLHDQKQEEDIYIGRWTGSLAENVQINALSPERLSYIVTNRETGVNFDLSKGWLGMMNHAPVMSPQNNTAAEPDGIIQTHDIGRGEELRWDYGAEYWVFQLTHLDLQDFRKLEQKALFKEMHERVVEYGELLAMKLYDTIAHARTDAEREKAKDEVVTKIKSWLDSYPKTVKFFIDNESRKVKNNYRVREAIYIKSKISGESESDEESELKSDASVDSCSPDLSHKMEVKTLRKWSYVTDKVDSDGNAITQTIRAVRLYDTKIHKSYYYIHAGDFGSVIDTPANVSRNIALYESPKEKLKLDIPNNKNHCIGKEANVLSLAGIERYVRTKLPYQHEPYKRYRTFIEHNIIPFLKDPVW